MSMGRRYPGRSDVTDWVRILDELWWYDTPELIALHNALHDAFGKEPNEAVVEGEKKLSSMLRTMGIEHRHVDELSELAGTTVENPTPATLEELHWFLQRRPLHSGAVKLVQGVESLSGVFVIIDNALIPEAMNEGILRNLKKMMPKGVNLRMLQGEPREDFARVMNAMDLVLTIPPYPNVEVTPWSQLISGAPEPILKSIEKHGRIKLDARIVQHGVKKTVLKDAAGMMVDGVEQFALSAVLFPGREDTQTEIYDKHEVRAACHWWAEHSGQFSERHVLQGGRACDPGEIVTLENYIMPVDCRLGELDIPEGTWMVGSGIRSPDIWEKVVAGELGAYSIGASAIVEEEEVPELAN